MRGTARSVEERARLVAAYEKSGVSVAVFAKRVGVPSSTVYQWLAKGRKVRPSAPTLPMARVVWRTKGTGEPTVGPMATPAVVVIDIGGARVHITAAAGRDTLANVFDALTRLHEIHA